jgi:RND family efflux transporter MFP subunit
MMRCPTGWWKTANTKIDSMTANPLMNENAPSPSGQWLRGLSLRLVAALAAVAAVLSPTGCKKAAPPPPPPPGVVVMDITTTNVPLEAEIIGQLDSPQNVEIRARVEAFVKEMPFIEGTNVRAGQLLFKLDDAPYQERLAGAKGGLAEAEAALKEYQADVARLKPLAEKRAVPQQDLDNAVASVDVGLASVFSAKARVQAADLDLSYCSVYAPTNGLIGAKQVSVGELVGKGTPTLMATMSTLDPIWIYCNASEVGLLNMDEFTRRTGKSIYDVPATLILANGKEHPQKGKVGFVDRAVDVKTGTIRIRGEFPNPGELLRPGMFARMRLDFGTRPDSILVPERAVTELQGKSFVWVVGADNKASQREVAVGQQFGENLLITNKLNTGDRIVVEGIQKLRDGVEVKPLTAEQAAALVKQAEGAPKAAKEGETKHGKE